MISYARDLLSRIDRTGSLADPLRSCSNSTSNFTRLARLEFWFFLHCLCAQVASSSSICRASASSARSAAASTAARLFSRSVLYLIARPSRAHSTHSLTIRVYYIYIYEYIYTRSLLCPPPHFRGDSGSYFTSFL